MTARCTVCNILINFGGRSERLAEMRHCGKEPERLIHSGSSGVYLSVKNEKIYKLVDGKFIEESAEVRPQGRLR